MKVHPVKTFEVYKFGRSWLYMRWYISQRNFSRSSITHTTDDGVVAFIRRCGYALVEHKIDRTRNNIIQ